MKICHVAHDFFLASFRLVSILHVTITDNIILWFLLLLLHYSTQEVWVVFVKYVHKIFIEKMQNRFYKLLIFSCRYCSRNYCAWSRHQFKINFKVFHWYHSYHKEALNLVSWAYSSWGSGTSLYVYIFAFSERPSNYCNMRSIFPVVGASFIFYPSIPHIFKSYFK